MGDVTITAQQLDKMVSKIREIPVHTPKEYMHRNNAVAHLQDCITELEKWGHICVVEGGGGP